MADGNKVLSLSNVKIIKDYITRSINTVSGLLSDEYNRQLGDLTEELERIKNNGTIEGIEELRLEIDALQNNFNDKTEALELLKKDFENLSNGITNGTVFSEGQLNEIIKTALIDETVITDEMVSTPNVFTQKIVALIGNFGKINAGQVDAGTLKGSTIESTTTIPNSIDPVWRIQNNGAGWLANKNIRWDETGNVTFGSGVSLDWSNIDSSGINTELKELSNKVIDVQNTANAASTAAANANTTANAANTAAANANTTANAANTAAANANTTANAASTAANEAKTAADAAKSKANAASSAIDTLNTRFDSLNNFSEDDIKKFSTQITKDTVTTAFVNALNVNAATIEATGLRAQAGVIKELAVDNLVVDKLNTDPDGNTDKIEIAENHLYCVNNEGKNNLIISSKEINTGVINALGDNQIGNDTPTTSLINFKNFIKLYDDNSTQGGAFSKIDKMIMLQYINKENSYQEPATIIIPGQSTGFTQQSIQELGTYFSGAKIWVKPHLAMRFMSNGLPFMLRNDSWDISCSCIVKLYKKKTKSASWKLYKYFYTNGQNVFLQANNPYTIKDMDLENQTINGNCLFANNNLSSLRNWLNSFSSSGSNGNINISVTPQNLTAIKQFGSWIDFDIDETCIYGINIELESYNIAGKSGNIADTIPFNTSGFYPIWISFNKDKLNGAIIGNEDANKNIDTLINANNVTFSLYASYIMDVENNNKPASYTELGKDGVVVYDGRHLLSLYSDGVEMKANSDAKNLGTTFYGFKVTKDGLYYCNGGSEYTKWTPS